MGRYEEAFRKLKQENEKRKQQEKANAAQDRARQQKIKQQREQEKQQQAANSNISTATSGTRTKLSEGRKAQLADSRKKTAERNNSIDLRKEEYKNRQKEFKQKKRADNTRNVNISAYLDNEGGVFEGKKGVVAKSNKAGGKGTRSFDYAYSSAQDDKKTDEKNTSLKDRYKAIKEDVKNDTKRYRENDYYGIQKADSPFTEDERKSIQAKAEKEKEESDGLKKELEYARTRHSAFTKNGKWENAKKEAENIKELEGKIKEKDKSIKQWQDLGGIKLRDRAANAIGGVAYTTASVPGIIAETGKTVLKDLKKNAQNKDFKDKQEEYTKKASQLAMKKNYGYANPEDAEKDPEYIKEKQELDKLGKEIEALQSKTAVDPNSRAMKNYGNALTYNEEALKGIEGSGRIVGETALTILDNLSVYPLGVINPLLPRAIMSTKAAAGRMYELNSEGKSAGESFLRGNISGAIEWATEGLPLENLYSMIRSGGKGVIKNLLRQGGIEATEEGLSYAANYIADRAANDPNAKWDWQDFAKSIIEGGLSGLFFAAGGTAISRATGKGGVRESADYSKGYAHYEGNDGNIYSLPKKDLSIQNLSEGIQKVDGFLNKLREDNARKAQYIAKEFGGMEYDAENIEKLKLYAGLENSDARTLDDIVREVAEGKTKKSKAREEMYMAGRRRLVEALGNVLAEGKTDQNMVENTRKEFLLKNSRKNNDALWQANQKEQNEKFVEDNPNAQYKPTKEELIEKSNAEITKIKTLSKNRKLDSVQFKNLYKSVRETVKSLPWFNKPLINGDTEFAEKYGKLRAKVVDRTLKKGKSYQTKYGIEQIEIMGHLPELFQKGKVINMKMSEKAEGNITRIITLLSPVEFEDGRKGVVKLNVKENSERSIENRIHENKILEITDAEFEPIEKDTSFTSSNPRNLNNGEVPYEDISSTGTASEDNGRRSAETSSIMSMAEMLEYVKGEDEKYIKKESLTKSIEEDAAPERQAKYREIVGRYAGEKTIGNMDKLAKRLGSEVVYYIGDDSSEGFYENGKIYLNANLVEIERNGSAKGRDSSTTGKSPSLRMTNDFEGPSDNNFEGSAKTNYWKIFKHEFTHAIEDSKAFKKDFTDWSLASGLYSEFIKNQGFIDEEGNADKAAYADSIRELYRKNGQELDDNGLNRELMAKFVQESDLFENEESINRLVNENRGFGQRILEWIRNTINKIKGVDPTAENMLKEAERLYEKAARETEKKGARNSGKQYSVKTPKGYYDYSKSFSQQIDDYKNENFPQRDTLIVGKTPEVLKKIGFNDLPVTINQKHIEYMLKNTKDADHYIGEINLKNLPDLIKKPVAVIRSNTNGNDSLVMLVDMNHNGKQVVAPIYIDGYGIANKSVIDANALGSTYAKGNAVSKLLKNAVITDSNENPQVFYLDAKKAIKLLRMAGHRLSGYSVLFNGYVHNITDANANINRRFENVTQTQQFKRWFGNWENEKRDNKKVSKVVDDKGKPKKLYHQTDAEIEAFDTSRKGSGYYDSQTPEGIFLKTTNKDIGLKGKKQIEVYADIKNPLVVENRTTLETWAKVDSKYKNAIDEAKAIDKKNEARYNELEAEDECERFLKEWKKEVNKANRKARVRLTELIKSKGYDGVHIKNDEGSFGRNIETWIAFKSNQVKSTDNLGTFDKNNPKIQYSFRQTNEELAESRMNAKAQSYTNKAVNKLLKSFKDSVGMTTYADKGIKDEIRQFANEYVEKGGMSEEEVNKVFDKLYENAMTFNTEYYDQYKDLKQALRTTKINIGAIKGTVAKDLGRGLRWSYDKGALGSDSFYQELSEQYPELFPENIINPEDQLEKMRDVAESIKPTEERLRDLGTNYGSSVEERAREAFNTAVEDMNESLADVINFKRERGKRAEAKEQRRAVVEQMHTNIKETKKIFSTSKDLNKKLSQMKNRYLWTEADGNALQRVLNGEITLDELPKNANKKAVNAVYETAKAAAETDQRLKDYKRGVAEQRRDMARELTINSNKYVDKKSGFQWESETPDRNFEDLAKETGDGKKLAEAYIKPIHENEAKAIRMKNEYRKKLSEFKLDTKPKYEIRSVDVNGNPVDKLVSESGLVQAYGEGIINDRDLENFKARILINKKFVTGGMDWNWFIKAVKDNMEGEMVEKSAVKVDGKRAEVRRILKDGTNYIAVRDSNIKIRYTKKQFGCVYRIYLQ